MSAYAPTMSDPDKGLARLCAHSRTLRALAALYQFGLVFSTTLKSFSKLKCNKMLVPVTPPLAPCLEWERRGGAELIFSKCFSINKKLETFINYYVYSIYSTFLFTVNKCFTEMCHFTKPNLPHQESVRYCRFTVFKQFVYVLRTQACDTLIIKKKSCYMFQSSILKSWFFLPLDLVVFFFLVNSI